MVPAKPGGMCAPGCALASITTVVIRKMTASTGNAYRSNTCTILWPKNAITTCASTMITRQAGFGRWVSVLSANVPLTLLTANQPMPAVSAFSPAGSTFPQ